MDDLGMVRVKSATSTTLKVARVSGINWNSSVYVTVTDDMGIWEKLPTMISTSGSGETAVVSMDDDISYTDQNYHYPVIPIMGPDLALPYVPGGTVPLDGTNSYTVDFSDADIDTYQWSIINGSADKSAYLSTPTASTCNFSPPAPGSYTVFFAASRGYAGETLTYGHRNIYLYDSANFKPIDQLTLDGFTSSKNNGGWQAQVTIWSDLSSSLIRDRAKVILIAQDYASGSSIAMGQVPGAEGTLMVGWIDKETVVFNKEHSAVSFTIDGPAFWLQQCTGPSTYLQNYYLPISGGLDVPHNWLDFNDFTFDKAIHHFLRWRSTAMECMDVYIIHNQRLLGGMSTSIDSIWEQLNSTATTRMLTTLACDRYGRFFAYVDPQVIPESDRVFIPVVQPIIQDDLLEEVNMKVSIMNSISLLEVAALAIPYSYGGIGRGPMASGSSINMFMSRAPGSLIYGRHGKNDLNDSLVVLNQKDANMLSGLLLAKKNNTYDNVTFSLAQNNKMIDIAPPMYVTFTSGSADTNRGFLFQNKKFLPTTINYRVDASTGIVSIDLTTEGYTAGPYGYTVIMPQEPIYTTPTPPDIPDYPVIPILIPPFDPTPGPYIPPPYDISGSGCEDTKDANGPYPIYFTSGWVYNDSSTGVLIATTPCKLRSAAATSPTRYHLEGNFQVWMAGSPIGTPTLDDNWYHVYAINEFGVTVAEGVHDPVISPTIRTGTFYPATASDIKWIQIVPIPNPIPIDTFYASGSFGGQFGGHSYNSGDQKWGLTPYGFWFRQLNSFNGPSSDPFDARDPAPFAFATSGSASPNYYQMWLTIDMKVTFRLTAGGANVPCPLQVVEVPYSPEPPKPYWSSNFAGDATSWGLNNYRDILHNRMIFYLPPRQNHDTSYSIYECEGRFNFQNGFSDVICFNFGGNLRTAGTTNYIIQVDELYLTVSRAATYRMQIMSAYLSNICENN
jgi:hypothetical protein